MPEPYPPKAFSDRVSGVLCVKCPHCGEMNEFPGFDEMDIFVCFHCGELVEVCEPKQ